MIDARIAKAGMVLALAAFALIVAYNNVVDFRTNYVFVQHVLSMDTVFPDSTFKGRAIVSEPVWLAAYWLIIVCEAVIGVLFLLGGVAMWRARRLPAEAFRRAKALVYAGATLSFLLWFFGFMVVGGEWFLMWQSRTWNGLQSAFRIDLSILGVLIFVNQPDPDAP
ncbi:DUF2165 family protein [Ralstonia pseudosolanacearum]|uniref:DUF2165 family protein n=1 Tax=Ralstonia pseudosolanacearum TaxID=1310165 RepID=UPI0002E10EB5|nr:hypothetical protein BCR16_20760 [Ralstonia solanacearum FJAT-1458]AXW73429.1 DUF2165 domain-containing protein [Ralstonia solanacearum]BEU69469.1 DUF2165 family protein [Ralstonia pseudosolanacearum]QKL74063.1 DUF2165 family protein [Ralstonia solanacearum]QKL79267.1 DUF2165 family protein [Ralstonia solanacearum]